MKLKNLTIDIKNDNVTRIKLTKRLPNGNTFIRYINQGEKKEICNSLKIFAEDYENKIKEIS